MIKNIVQLFFALLLIFKSSIGISQKTIELEWTSPVFSGKGTSATYMLSFVGAENDPARPSLPVLVLNFEGKSISNFNILHPQYVDLTEEEKQLIPESFKADSLQIQIRKGIKNKSSISLVDMVPLRWNSSHATFQKLLKFSYTFTEEKISRKQSASALRTAAASSSVLSEGEWFKLKIKSTETQTGSGLYKIDYDLLKSMLGSNIDQLDARKIRLLGNGGGMLPEPNTAFKYDDLQENAIFIQGESDGKFDKNDYILFYGKGPDSWKYDSIRKVYRHIKNIYSDESFYFLTIGPNEGKRIATKSDTGAIAQTLTTYPEHQFYEKDEYNLLQSGKVWFGDKFDLVVKRNYDNYFSLEGIAPESGAILTQALMAQSLSPSRFEVTVNGTKTNYSISSSTDDYGVKGVEEVEDIILEPLGPGANTNLGISINYVKSTNRSVGYLNYLELNFSKTLRFTGGQLSFRSKKFAGVSQFVMENASTDMQIWEVSDPIAASAIPFDLVNGAAVFTSNTSEPKEFIAFQGSNFEKPVYEGVVENQNLHSMANGDLPDLLIVTTKELLPSANALADFRTNHDQLKVAVVTTHQIYNEFSSGAQDLVAIRNFVKMLYDKNSSSDSLSYLLFFGASSYDYKNRVKDNTNLVPMYQTPQSLNNIDSQSSDDYCGFLDDMEGDWENNRVVHYMDIGIGRLVVRNLTEANQVVRKLIHYSSSPACLGNWRNKVTLVCDNQDPSYIHMKNAEVMANTIAQNTGAINVNKLYMDAYPTVPAPGGESCPAIKEALLKDINKGTLIVNYSGHGSEYLWAQEFIMELKDFENLKNINNLSFFITATCEFGRYDDPEKFSGAISLVLNPEGGAIGLLTSTRPVYAFSNETINKAFYSEAFNFKGNNKPRLGTIMMKTKNNSIIGFNNKNYALLGDPSMMLAYPEEQIVITGINDNPVSAVRDTLKALKKVTLQGEVRNNDQLSADFNGNIAITIFDKPATIETKAQNFKLQNSIIFDGAATVKNGKFSVSFIVSKDISYTYGIGKISMYSHDSSKRDAGGYFTNIIIGGSTPNAPTDTIPPSIRLFIGDETFVSGGLASSNTRLIAKLADSSGINISNSGIGHEIIGILNSSKEVIVMNDFYSSEQDNYKKGTLNYPLNNLAPGKYSLQVKAWDTYNNSSMESIDFVVTNKDALQLQRVVSAPNPFSDLTTISFEHNRSGEDMEASIWIYSMTGDLVKNIETKIFSSPSRVSDVTWDGRDGGGARVNAGMYICKLKVSIPQDGAQVTQHVKLILLN